MTKPIKRFPFLMWGDLVEGRRPVLRRALAGFRAHECMYAWVYLTEYLAHRRLLEQFARLPAESRSTLLQRMDGDLWAQLDRAQVDPHFQLSKAMFESVAAMTCLASTSGETQPAFVELGSTFFTSRTRFTLIDQIARERFSDWPRLEPRWVGIDNSRFMHDTTRALHGESGITLVDDYRSAPKPESFAVFLSRFVASYAFPHGKEFADYLAERFPVALVEDAYSTTGEELHVFNHGQSETFFSIPEVFGMLNRHGMEIFVLNSYPDHPAGATPCHIIRYLVSRKGLVTEKVRERMAGLGFIVPGEPADSNKLLQELNDSVSPASWRAVRNAKKVSPVWGPTPDIGGAAKWNSLVRSTKDLVKHYFVHPRWRRYRFSGPLAVREIHRAVSEEKP